MSKMYNFLEKDQLKLFPNVFMDVSVNGNSFGRIEFELFSDCPLTSENFRCLCTGEKGIGKSGNRLHYKGSIIHRIVPNFLVQGGDITDQNGTGGESIYGYTFKDENFNHNHNEPYMLAMANCGQKNSNSSQFYITTGKCE